MLCSIENHTVAAARHVLLPLLLLVMLALFSGVAHASTNKSCLATWEEPKVNIKVLHARPNIDHRKTSEQIERVAAKSGFAKSARHLHLLGLTNSMIGPRLSIKTRVREVAKGRFCLRLEAVNFTFGAHKTDIYIERKYNRSSCAYKTILAHEQKHVQINDQVISDFIPRITQELTERAGFIRPFLTRQPEDAGKSLVNRLLMEMKPMMIEFSKTREAANDVIDTDRAYAATHKKCRDW